MRSLALIVAVVLCGGPIARAAAADGRCRGLYGAVAKDDLPRVRAILAGGCEPAKAAGLDPLRLAAASARVETARLLLEAGADPNAADRRGSTAARWLASRPGVGDDDALAVATLLYAHGCDFARAAPGLLLNLAPRRLPKTLAFLASKGLAGEATAALRVVARGDDEQSVRALLAAGADPLAGAARGSALLDAALAGRTASVELMLARVKDKSDAKVRAAYEGALRKGQAEVARLFEGAGVQPAPARPRPACEPTELTSEQRALLGRLGLPNGKGLAGLAGQLECKLLARCGDLLLVDCNSAADGPAYYLDPRAEQVLATCGGACMRGNCTDCPPKPWSCACVR